MRGFKPQSLYLQLLLFLGLPLLLLWGLSAFNSYVSALQAATHPAPGDALYFVAIGDGSGRHVFSSSLDAHNVAVAAYLRNRRAAGPAP